MTGDVGDNVAIKNDQKVTTEATVKTSMMNVKAGEGFRRHAKTLTVTGTAALTTENATVCDI